MFSGAFAVAATPLAAYLKTVLPFSGGELSLVDRHGLLVTEEKNLILERAGRNNAGKPLSTAGFVDEVVAATAELQREMAQAAERERRQSDRAFQDELVKSHTDRSYSNRRAASWVSETLDPQANA